MIVKIVAAAFVCLTLIFAVLMIHTARRIDRLNTLVMKSRHALEQALHSRAHNARLFADCGVLDIASSLLLVHSADECIQCAMWPLTDDNLDLLGQSPDSARVAERCATESALSRSLRLTVDEWCEGCDVDFSDKDIVKKWYQEQVECGTPEFSSLTDEQIELFSQVQRARLDVRMTRSFHNSHVEQVRRLRRKPLVRIMHLAGKSSVAQTVDIDDE